MLATSPHDPIIVDDGERSDALASLREAPCARHPGLAEPDGTERLRLRQGSSEADRLRWFEAADETSQSGERWGLGGCGGVDRSLVVDDQGDGPGDDCNQRQQEPGIWA